MQLLLDTHVYLWALLEPKKLSRKVRTLLEDRDSVLLVSSASAWEIATKVRLGKLSHAEHLVISYERHLARLGADELPIASKHALAAGAFSSKHRDPFDRMLAAQAMLEALPLVSRDEAFEGFPIDVVW